MLLHLETVRRLGSSPFHYWFGYVANAALVIWMAAHATLMAHAPRRPAVIVAQVGFGLLLWTFLEYVLHRFVYHVLHSFLSVGHSLHHRRPRALIGVPWYLTTVAVLLTFWAMAMCSTAADAGTVGAAVWSGYIGYCMVHHAVHHARPHRRLLARLLHTLRRRHMAHHAHPGMNWGVTTGLWDWAFGTAYAPARRGRP